MKEVILWLFSKVSEFISTSLTWKIYGDFSFTHFILAATFLFAIFKFFGFGADNYGNGLEEGVLLYKNAENKRDKQNYTHFLKSERYKQNGKYITETRKYKVHKKTGEVTEL